MRYKYFNRSFVMLLLVVVAVCGVFATRGLSAKNGAAVASALPSPSPTPRTREELPQDSDEIIKVETNLTNIFFTAADKNKRFVSNLKPEDIRVFEDGQQQDIFTFQTNIDLPLSLAILIDCSASEERTLPDEKQAARAFLENILRPGGKDEAAILSFTGETARTGFSGNIERSGEQSNRVAFVPPSVTSSAALSLTERRQSRGPTRPSPAQPRSGRRLGHLGRTDRHLRRAHQPGIILLTDGDDTSSRLKMDEHRSSPKADALIYAIGNR